MIGALLILFLIAALFVVILVHHYRSWRREEARRRERGEKTGETISFSSLVVYALILAAGCAVLGLVLPEHMRFWGIMGFVLAAQFCVLSGRLVASRRKEAAVARSAADERPRAEKAPGHP